MLTVIAGCEAMAFQQPLGVEFFSGYPIINAEASERLENIETAVAD